MTLVAPTQSTFDLLNACVQHLGAAILAIWGVHPDGTCRCPKGKSCESPGKHPNYKLCPNGFKNATRDAALIRQWTRQAPNGNWALRCGDAMPGGGFLGVFDTDPRNGSEESVRDLLARGSELPDTVTQASGGGGGHRVYRFPVSPASRSLGPGLDLQGAGKYIVIAPSLHTSKGTYAWELGQGPGECKVADAPQWMVEGTAEAVPRPTADGGTARETVLGEIFSLAGKAGPVMPDGTMFVECVQAHLHGDARGRGEDASTVILPPAGGSLFGGYKCLHGHCANLKWQDVVKKFPQGIIDEAHRKYPRMQAVPPQTTTEDEKKEEQEGPPRPPTEEEQIRAMSLKLHYKNTKGSSVLKSDILNLIIILTYDPRWKGVLKYDDFSQVLRFTRPPPWHPEDIGKGSSDVWSDEDVTRLDLWLRRYWSVEMKNDKLREAVYVVGRRDSVNPLQDYLNSLKWDSTNRLDMWLTNYAGAKDTAYVRSVGRKWLLSAVARAYEPGCKVDTCIILEGPQGKGKSTLLRKLSPREEWFSDTPIPIGEKDSYVALRGKWLLELAELASLKKADLDKTKCFFSSPVDSYRPPYGREQITVPRTAVFAGTVNSGEYLNDATGARRFLPVKCGTIDLEAVVTDRDQIWAEAVHVYKDWVARGRKQSECLWWASPEEQPEYENEQVLRQVAGTTHPWAEAIALWLQSGAAKKLLEANGYLQLRVIAKFALSLEDKDLDSGSLTNLGIIMVRDLGWKKDRVNVAGVKSWGYKPGSC